MRKGLTALWLITLLLIAGCTATARPATAPPANVPKYPRDQVVLQLDHGGGFWYPTQASELIPEVTLWGDGQVVFVAPDGSIKQGRLDKAALDRMVAQATLLYDLNERYDAVTHTDAATASFTVMTEKGRKTVQVYGLDPAQGKREGEPHPEIFSRLRDLWAKVIAALPANAPAMQPNVVQVLTRYSEDAPKGDWPAELKGHLSGAAARRAWDLAPGTYRVDGRVQQVLAIPVLPRPHNWDQDPIGLPAQVTGRNDDGALAFDITATRQPDDSYKVAVILRNKSERGIDLLFNCGSLLWWEGLKLDPIAAQDRACPDVYSQLLEPGKTHEFEATLATGAVADWQNLTVAVKHRTGSDQIHTLLTHLRRSAP
ncbi:MAG TPA: hypothetical protein VNT75_19280 [Symbiobacteriaceae bacterium]|nr:hypothetical protein [Symbiobacteriaceae bacterium]